MNPQQYIETFSIARDEQWYLAWPDVALTDDGRLLCVYNECRHHSDRSHTRIMMTESADRGRSWSPPQPFTESSDGKGYSYNCPRISWTGNGRLTVIVDRVPAIGEAKAADQSELLLFHSLDQGRSWRSAEPVPLHGIVPDRVQRSDTGRLFISAHHPHLGKLAQFAIYSDDAGKSWSPVITVAADQRFQLCEGSLLPLGQGRIVAFLRENSGCGYDCKKVISHDDGETWSEVIDFPLPGCHRPVTGVLKDGRIFITYRFMQGGCGWLGVWTQNFFCALSDEKSALATERNQAHTRIIPVDYDRSSKADLGYSGWVQFPDGEIYIVNYIVDEALVRGQIRGYSLDINNFTLGEKANEH